MSTAPEFQIEVTLSDRVGYNVSEVVRCDSLGPRDVARLIGDYAHSIYAMPHEVNARVRCVHKDR